MGPLSRDKVLVVEDDPAILTGLTDLLRGEGFEVCCAVDGRTALDLFESERPTLVLLDIMIPEKSGYEVCRAIRRTDPLTPILMLTAKGEEVDKIAGLELGADDYIVKPFSIGELLDRVRADCRRRQAAPAAAKEPWSFGEVRIDPARMELRRGERRVPLTARELKLLQLFRSRPGEVLERGLLLEEVWGVRYEGTTRTLDQHIAQLRKKIEDDPAAPRRIRTVHGIGYRFTAGEDG